MRKWFVCVLLASLVGLLVLSYRGMKSTAGENGRVVSLTMNATSPLKWVHAENASAVQITEKMSNVISTHAIVSGLFTERRNSSAEEVQSLLTWTQLEHLLDLAQSLPNAVEAVKEAGTVWKNLVMSTQEDQSSRGNNPEKQKCPYFFNILNFTGFDDGGFEFFTPCGLTHGSSITVVGIPTGILGDFRIDMIGEAIAGGPEPPIILHYNVRIHGDKMTGEPVIVQNTWTSKHGWGEEERCPSPALTGNGKVDELEKCSRVIGSNSSSSGTMQKRYGARRVFPFRTGRLFVTTVSVGEDGIQTSVDGRHATSFAHREGLDPWQVNAVRISGDVRLVSIAASGLPTSDDAAAGSTRSDPLPYALPPHLFVGVFSTANNFGRRMAVRKTWMRYPDVLARAVAVRFFVGLHKNHLVNQELWREARAYGDLQLMPFVDYYSLITWKTLSICIFGTEVARASLIMKTDDDAFVRVDEVLARLKGVNTTRGLLFGLINSDSRPHRNPDSKWYIKPEEWKGDRYPPWAHGPGYVVSSNVASAVFDKYKKGELKMFKLEDVAMGIWVDEMRRGGMEVEYVNEARVYNNGCEDGFVVAHYQSPREMLCLWLHVVRGKPPRCCSTK